MKPIFLSLFIPMSILFSCTVARTYEAPNAQITWPAKVSPNCPLRVKKIGLFTTEGKLNFTVQVRKTGTYAVEVEYGATELRSAVVTVNNVALAGTFDFPATNLQVVCGTKTLEIQMDLQIGINSIHFGNPTAKGPEIASITIPFTTAPTKLLAKDATNTMTTPVPSTAHTCTYTYDQISMDSSQSLISFAYTSSNSRNFRMKIEYSADVDTEVKVSTASEEYSFSLPNANCSTYAVQIEALTGLNLINLSLPNGGQVKIASVEIGRNNQQGMLYGAAVNATFANRLSPFVTWYYRYQVDETEDSKAWADENDIEFVPMVHNKFFTNKNFYNCKFKNILADRTLVTTLCTPDRFVARLNKSNNMDRVAHLMGFNEPYPKQGHEKYSVEDATWLWRMIVQPAAEQAGLTLISSTMKTKDKGMNWTVDFMHECCLHEDNATAPCNIDKIRVLAIHEYKCKVSWWEDRFGENPSYPFYTTFLAYLQEKGPTCSKMGSWKNWLDSRKLWLTETNCYWEGSVRPTNEQGCNYVTGRNPTSHGVGSIQWFQQTPWMSRYAWWTTRIDTNPGTGQENKTQLLIDFNSGVTNPTGRAYMHPYSTTTCTNTLLRRMSVDAQKDIRDDVNEERGDVLVAASDEVSRGWEKLISALSLLVVGVLVVAVVFFVRTRPKVESHNEERHPLLA